MKNTNELKRERAQVLDSISKFQSEVEKRDKAEYTDEENTRMDSDIIKAENLGKEIERSEKRDNLLKLQSSKKEVETRASDTSDTNDNEDTIASRYVTALRGYFKNGVAAEEFRSTNGKLILRDDLLTTTDAGLILHDVEKSLNIAKTPVLIDKLGTKKKTGMIGQFDLTSMGEITASFAGEGVAVPDASAYPQTPVSLGPRRLGAYAVISQEELNSTNPNVWADVVQDLKDAWDRGVSNDAITQVFADTVDASTTIAGASFTVADALKLQANIPYDMINPVYIASPDTASKLAGTVDITGGNNPIWAGNVFEGTIRGIPAYSSSSVSGSRLMLVDAAKITTAYFGPKTILFNPYEYDEEGKLKVVVSGSVDSGFGNYRFASWYNDASIA